jgi:hypothetical protein
MKRLTTLLAFLSLLGLGMAASAPGAATTVTASQSFPLDLVVFVPCAAGGTGETVELSGNVHELFHLTSNASGGFVTKILSNAQGMSGVGSTTGAQYRGTGGTQRQLSINAGVEDTFVNTFQIIGQGPGNNFLVHQNVHITINANGDLTVVHDNFSIDCR